MSEDDDQTNSPLPEVDFSAYPQNALFHDRRGKSERRGQPAPAKDDSTRPAPAKDPERRVKKERRGRIDPTTFEKQYTDEEMEFMNAMQRFKELSGTSFPSYGDVLKVAVAIGYRKVIVEVESLPSEIEQEKSSVTLAPVVEHPVTGMSS